MSNAAQRHQLIAELSELLDRTKSTPDEVAEVLDLIAEETPSGRLDQLLYRRAQDQLARLNKTHIT